MAPADVTPLITRTVQEKKKFMKKKQNIEGHGRTMGDGDGVVCVM